MGYIIILLIITLAISIMPLIAYKKNDDGRSYSLLSFIPMFAMIILWISSINYHDIAANDIVDHEIITNLNNVDIDNMTPVAKYKIYKKQNNINNRILKNKKNNNFWYNLWYDERYENLELLNI